MPAPDALLSSLAARAAAHPLAAAALAGAALLLVAALVALLARLLRGGASAAARNPAREARARRLRAARDAAAASAPLPAFSAAECARHCARDDLWLVVNRRVYDLTEYVDNHPGGDSILRTAGRDSTAGFEGPQHPASVHDLISTYLIGRLAEGGSGAVAAADDAAAACGDQEAAGRGEVRRRDGGERL